MTLDDAILLVTEEAKTVNDKQGEYSMSGSTHKGYALVLEELDEAWVEIKSNNRIKSIQEMKQVAATAIRYIHQMSNESN